jgi:hypothetical protein
VAPNFDVPDGLKIWLVEPLGMITQVGVGMTLSVEMTNAMRGRAYDALQTRAGGDHPFWFVHDFADVAGYTPEARSALVGWPGSIGKQNIQRMVVCLSQDTGWPIRMSVELGVSMIRLAGFPIDVVFEPLPGLVARLGLNSVRR